MTRPERCRRDDELLRVLLADVRRARTEFQSGRSERVDTRTRGAQTRRAARLAAAMQSYAEAAASAGVPLPYRCRDELRLYESVAGECGDLGLPTAG